MRVCYEPVAGERFIEWFAGVEGYDQDDICPDARFMDTNWDTNCLEFDVSGNTWVMPIVDTDPYRTYSVHRPYPFMNYGETVPEGTFTVPYRKVVEIKAVPYSGFVFTHWRAFPGGAFYENPLHVMVKCHNAEFIPGFADIRDGSSPPPPPSFTGTVALEGGSGEVFTSDSAPGTVDAHVQKSSCLAANFAARVEVGKNFFPAYWGWSEQGIDKCSVTSTTEIATIIRPLSADTTFTLHLAERIRLNVLVEGEGMIPGYLPYTYNPIPYVNTFNIINALEPAPDINANKVTLSASPHPGWEFSHWEILRDTGWEAVRNSNGLPLEGDLDIWMNWWDDPAHPGRHVPRDEPIFNVKAVFLRPWVILLSGECEFSGQFVDCSGSGLNVVLRPMLEPCYTVDFYNEDVVNPDGSGWLYEEIVLRLRGLKAKSVMLIGHSHGGGSIYNLCNLFEYADSAYDHNKPGVRSLDICFTGYIDAISEDMSLLPISAERKYPPSSLRHGNLYQEITIFPIPLNGATTIDENGTVTSPNFNINLLPRVFGQTHQDIDDCVIVHDIYKNILDNILYSFVCLPLYSFGDDNIHNCIN